MRRLPILPLLLFAATAFGQSQFRIIDIETPAIPPGGGKVAVVYAGSYLGPFSATVDGVPVPVQARGPFTIVVTAPPHSRGPAELKIGGTTADTSATATLRYVTNDDYERVLLPMAIIDVVPGANGSRWTTAAWAWNASSEFLDISGNFPTALGPSPVLPAPPLHLVPGGSESVVIVQQGGGALLRIPRWPGRTLTFNTRVVDISRQASTLGTELPVVRESAFAPSQFLLNVPGDPRFRAMLRVYTLDGPARVNVRADVLAALTPILDPPIFGPLLDVKLDLPAPADNLSPGYAQLPIASFGVPLQMTITSDDPSQKIWAFVSITNNETQQVTLVTPQ